MASLKGNTEDKSNTKTAAFEGEDETHDRGGEAVVAAPEVTEAPAQVSTSTAVATQAQNTGVAVAKPKLQTAFADKNGYIDAATAESLSLAVPRIKGEQGAFTKGTEDLGSKIRFEPISFSPRWAIGTGVDDKEAADYFRVSYDNETIAGAKDGGMSIQAYIDGLKAQGFTKANKSEYLDMFCFITWTEKQGDIPPDQREMVLLQCSPTSKGNWVAFMTTRGLLEARGIAKPLEIVEAEAVKQVSGNNKFTNMKFSAPKA